MTYLGLQVIPRVEVKSLGTGLGKNGPNEMDERS